jgi:hypothetical protein
MGVEKHELAGVPETLLIPLWARAREQTREKPLIIDPTAARIVASLDYDFGQFERKNVATEDFCVRANLIDQVVRDALGTGDVASSSSARGSILVSTGRAKRRRGGWRSIFRKSSRCGSVFSIRTRSERSLLVR